LVGRERGGARMNARLAWCRLFGGRLQVGVPAKRAGRVQIESDNGGGDSKSCRGRGAGEAKNKHMHSKRYERPSRNRVDYNGATKGGDRRSLGGGRGWL